MRAGKRTKVSIPRSESPPLIESLGYDVHPFVEVVGPGQVVAVLHHWGDGALHVRGSAAVVGLIVGMVLRRVGSHSNVLLLYFLHQVLVHRIAEEAGLRSGGVLILCLWMVFWREAGYIIEVPVLG